MRNIRQRRQSWSSTACSGLLSDSPLKLPHLPIRKTPRDLDSSSICHEQQTELVCASLSFESNTDLQITEPPNTPLESLPSSSNDTTVNIELLSSNAQPYALHSPNVSTTLQSKKRGRPTKRLDLCSIARKIQRIRDFDYPGWVLHREVRSTVIEFHVKTIYSSVLTVHIDCLDLTSLVFFNFIPLRPETQPVSLFRCEEDVLEFMHKLRSYYTCQGIQSKTINLSKRRLFFDAHRLLLLNSKPVAYCQQKNKLVTFWRSLSCDVLTSSRTQCQHCSALRAKVYGGHNILSLDSNANSHVFSAKLMNLNLEKSDIWTPFLRGYLIEIADRSKTQEWSVTTTIFALGMYSKLGVNSYEDLRKSLPLPSSSTLQRICNKVDAAPGIQDTAIVSFLQREPIGGINLSFDEIYLTQGIQYIKSSQNSYIAIGYVACGDWSTPNSERIRYLFSYPEEVPTIPGHNDLPEHESQHNHPSALWCSDQISSSILTNLPSVEGRAKMALHFIISSVHSNTAQAIGYIETESVTSDLLRALIWKILTTVNLLARQVLPSSSCQSAPEPLSEEPIVGRRQSEWNNWTTFAEDWSSVEIEMPDLTPNSIVEAPWLTCQTPSITIPYVACITFDGSSHARSFVNRCCTEQLKCKILRHPSQKMLIFCISDVVHLFKRFRNNLMNKKIFMAPKIDEIHHPLDVYATPFCKQFYTKMQRTDEDSILSISRISMASIDLTPRTKQSFPLAKALFAPRSQICLDILEKQASQSGDFVMKHMSFTAKAISNFANQWLARTRARWTLTGEFRRRASQQLFELYQFFREWKKRNDNFMQEYRRTYPLKSVKVPAQLMDTETFGFFDNQFVKDWEFTICGLSFLCVSCPTTCLRLITTDVVESFFSTVRSSIRGGGGQLSIRLHRLSVRRAMFVRIHLLSYLGESIPRQQPLLTLISKKKDKYPSNPGMVNLNTPPASLLTRPILEHQRTIIRYVAGWMIHSLKKQYPSSDEVGTFIDRRVRRLICPSQMFSNLIERLLISSHHCLNLNRHLLMVLAQPRLSQYLQEQHMGDFAWIIDNDIKTHICDKISIVLLADKAKKLRNQCEKSFRNSLV